MRVQVLPLGSVPLSVVTGPGGALSAAPKALNGSPRNSSGRERLSGAPIAAPGLNVEGSKLTLLPVAVPGTVAPLASSSWEAVT